MVKRECNRDEFGTDFFLLSSPPSGSLTEVSVSVDVGSSQICSLIMWHGNGSDLSTLFR